VNIGIIGFQGDVEEHAHILDKINSFSEKINVIKVRNKDQLKNISALIIPGGESTTIYKLIKEYEMYDEIINLAKKGIPIMGTCAGLILISKETNDTRVKGMGLLDVEIKRNGYGRQAESFIEDIDIKYIGKFKSIFIRAPIINKVLNGEVMAYHGDLPIMVRDRNIIGLTFHPELTEDLRIHEFFIKMVGGGGSISTGEIKRV
jgi:5'-phosphate synthase pdxT subunit